MRSKPLASNSSKSVSSMQEDNKLKGEMGISPNSDQGFVKVAHCFHCVFICLHFRIFAVCIITFRTWY